MATSGTTTFEKSFYIDDTTDNVVGFETVAASDTITLDGTTTGGITHATIVCTVLATGLWKVSVNTGGSGNLATPFSAAV